MSPVRKIYALKRIRLSGHDGEAAQGFADEIQLLRRLQGKENIIQLIDAEVGPGVLACLYVQALVVFNASNTPAE